MAGTVPAFTLYTNGGALDRHLQPLRLSSPIRLARRSADPHVNLRLTRGEWESQRRDDIEIIGLDGCREMFGAA